MDKQRGAWRILGESVRGASHIVNGSPNQDAIAWWPVDPRDTASHALPLIVAVADGHGSARSFRSQRGAQLAVETAIEVLRSFVAEQGDEPDLAVIERMAEERLPRELVSAWKDRVEALITESPFTPEEHEKLEKIGTRATNAIAANPLLAYGTTILSALVTGSYIIYLQLGDGDILTVSAAGEVARAILKDTRFLANETTSLCLPYADREVQICVQSNADDAPALILLCTDGYSNSFRDDDNFLKIGSDLHEVIRDEGLPGVSANLTGWLNQTSRGGSGDDITLGIVCQLSAFQNTAKS